jgi:hypothetical protein
LRMLERAKHVQQGTDASREHGQQAMEAWDLACMAKGSLRTRFKIA